MYYQTTTHPHPEAYITVNKKRIRQYGKNVYMDNKQEFEIELYNPTQNKVLAVITLNGTKMTGGGVVIKPGQRIFLERYLDSNNKFLFDTYEVESTNEILDAISNNGDIQINFYNEEQTPHKLLTYNNNTWVTTNATLTLNNPGRLSEPVMYNTNLGGFGLTSGSLNYYNTPRSRSNKTLSLETGRVEKGAESNQTFVSSKDRFEYNSFSEWTWKILPSSVKPYDSKDLKKFCTNCGSKIKKDSYKFCPNCGTKI